jgi:hypothetical protein
VLLKSLSSAPRASPTKSTGSTGALYVTREMAADWENILKYKEKIYHICSNERERREKEERQEEGGEKTSKSFPLSAGVYFFSSSTISTRLHPCPYSFITKITFFFLLPYIIFAVLRAAAPG